MQMINFSMEELLPVVAWLTEKYTSKESTSVSYDRARQLMEAAIYCIKHFDGQGKIVSDKGVSVNDIYKAGYENVKHKVKKAQEAYQEMMTKFKAYGNENYYDTVTKAIPGFFRYYDTRFAPQETIITMDYPTICTIVNCSGIDAIEKYVEYISYEQRFMGALPQEYVQEVLSGYQANYKKQFYNVCSIVLRHVLGNALIGKTLGQVTLEEDYKVFQTIVIQHERKWLEEIFYKILKKLIEEKYNSDRLLEEYLKVDIEDFVAETQVAARNNCIKKVVIL